jgi:hypothetical protein
MGDRLNILQQTGVLLSERADKELKDTRIE